MNQERRKLIDELFLSAVELPPDQRSAFLSASCPDGQIAEEVASLLRFDAGGESPLERVVQEAAVSLIASEQLVGARLGPYRIAEEIGKGGMGAVYLAFRDDDAFEKRVAIKVVKRGMDSESVLDRFRHERRILANLNHPNISHLIDAGTTPDGRPYFVMEYVAGQPVVAYAKGSALDVNATLDLFRKICDAVSYAHRNLVVHRDLKVGNILVTADGEPKLLDFGIAKLLDPQNRSEQTAPASRMLTLNCASPEQIRGEPVTTSSDIYSLGVLLFELLAGQPPWEFNGVGFTVAAEIVCSAPPPRPSSFRPLSGDLDNIVLMALRKDPARRYRSVDEFSEDIRRFQAGLPVIARDDSFAYRSAKFLRRHRLPAILCALAVAGLVIGIIDANIQRRHAEARLAQMLGMANQTLLDLQTQIEHQPGATETRLRIVQSTLAYLANLAKEAGNNQDVRTTLGVAYLRTGDVQGRPNIPNVGDSDGALDSYAKAEKLLAPDDHIHLAALLLHRGEVLCAFGRIPECLNALRQSLAHASKSDSKEAMITMADTYHRIAFTLTGSHPEEALANSRHEMEIYVKLAEREPANAQVLDGLASSYSTTGGALERRGRMEESLALYRKGLAIRERLVAERPNDVALRRNLMISFGRIGDALRNRLMPVPDLPAALASFRKAQAIGEALAAADPKNSLARMDLVQIWSRIGAALNDPAQARESLAMLDSARQTLVSLEQGKTISNYQRRAMSTIDEFRGQRLAALGEFPAAVAAIRAAIDEIRTALVKDPSDGAAKTQLYYSLDALGPTLALSGHRDEAIRAAEQSVSEAARGAVDGPDPVYLSIFAPRAVVSAGDTYAALARRDQGSLQRAADWRSAAANYSRALELWQELATRKESIRAAFEVKECSKKLAEATQRAAARGDN